jgi:hypothetical protein
LERDAVQWKREGAFATGQALRSGLEAIMGKADVVFIFARASAGGLPNSKQELWVWGYQGPDAQAGGMQAVVLMNTNTAVDSQILAVRMQPVDAQYFHLLAHRLFPRSANRAPQPVGYVGLDARGDVCVLRSETPLRPPGVEYQWTVSARINDLDANQYALNLRVCLWNRSRDPAHETWRHPTRAVVVRGDRVTTDIWEDPTLPNNPPTEWFVLPDK